MGDLIAPDCRLAIAFGQCGAHVPRKHGPQRTNPCTQANGSFHTPFLIAPAYLARLWSEVIMGAQLDQPGIESDEIAEALQHGALEIVVKNHARLAGPGFEGI